MGSTMVPMSMGAPSRSSARSSRSRAICPGRSRRRVPWGSHPSPNAAVRRMAAGEEPPIQMGGRGFRTGRGPSPMSRAGKRGPGSSGNSSVRQRASAETASSVWRPRSSKPPVRNSYSSGTWPAPTPTMSRPPERRSIVDSSLAARSGWRWARIRTCDSRCVCVVTRGQPAQGRGGVVPDGAHGVGQAARDGGVVAHAEIEETRLVGDAGDAGQLGRAGVLLPVGDVERRLRLDRQLHPVDDLPLGHGAHHVGGEQRGIGHRGHSVPGGCRGMRAPMLAQAAGAGAGVPSHDDSSAALPKVVASTRDRLRCRCSGTSHV